MSHHSHIISYGFNRGVTDTLNIPSFDSKIELFTYLLNYSTNIEINSQLVIYLNKSNKNINIDLFNNLLHYRFYYLYPIIIPCSEIIIEDKSSINDLINTRYKRILYWISSDIEKPFTIYTYIKENLPSIDKRLLVDSLIDEEMNNTSTTDNTSQNIYERLSDINHSIDNKRSLNQLLKERMFFDEELSKVQYRQLLNIPNNETYYKKLINSWEFNAFQFSSDELIYIAYIILINHIPNDNEENNSISNHLLSFLFFVRDSYRIGNPFHNFRHAIDVLQSTNYFINQLNLHNDKNINSIDIISLLFASLGHDIGHPGITNMYLQKNNCRFIYYYNKLSILENYHNTLFQNILQPFIKNIKLNLNLNLIKDAILATDMANHSKFVEKISNEINKISNTKNNNNNNNVKDNFTLLACLLIKCADISNVCRPIDISFKWGNSLTDEFEQISILENTDKVENLPINVKSFDYNLLSSKLINDYPKLPNNQLFFINTFAKSFFEKISVSLPQLIFLHNTLSSNTIFWENHKEKKNS